MVSREGESDSDADSEKSSARKSTRKKRPTRAVKPPPPQKTQVTLSGLLNTLDGPGSKEGHAVILTTNAPESLDAALIRPGRIGMKVYLGYSTNVTAAITFVRIFGSDKRLTTPKKELNRLSKQFRIMVPNSILTPAEVQRFCTDRRGSPYKAVRELPEYLKEKRSGKPQFEYDINRTAPKAAADPETVNEDQSSDETEETPTSSAEDMRTNEPYAERSALHSQTRGPFSVSNLSVKQSNYHLKAEDGLAYGEYYPPDYDVHNSISIGDSIQRKVTGFLDALASTSSKVNIEDICRPDVSVSEIVMPLLIMHASHSVHA